MIPELTRSHRSTYDVVFQHPVARNLYWRELCSMLGTLPGVVLQEHDGAVKVTRNGKTQVLHGQVHKNIASVQEVMDLRRFLEQSDTSAQHSAADGKRQGAIE